METVNASAVAQNEPPAVRMTSEQRYAKLRRMLRDRGLSVKELARLATKAPGSRAHVTQVLKGLREGGHTWPRLADYLTHEEFSVIAPNREHLTEKNKSST